MRNFTVLLCCIALPIVGAFTAGCGNDSDTGGPAQPADDGGGAPPTASPRSLVTRPLYATSVSNLILDPTLHVDSPGGRGGGGYSAGSFYVWHSDMQDVPNLASRLDSQAPGGIGGEVASLRDRTGSNTTSRPFIMITPFLGGKGAFTARVWVSHSTIKGDPAELPEGPGAFSVTLATDASGAGISIHRNADKAMKVGERTWHLFEGEVSGGLDQGGFFLLEFGTQGGQFEIAAPEVVPNALLHGQSPASLHTPHAQDSHALSPMAARAIKKVRSIPPELAPPRLPKRHSPI